MTLRAISDESDPLSRDELLSRGRQLLNVARNGAVDALRVSTRSSVLKTGSFSIAAVRVMHEDVKQAITEWRKVEAALAELLNEFDKARAASPR